jgi:predicted phage-related endonuclease
MNRNEYIGGHDVAAILGMSKYATAYDVQRAKLNPQPDEQTPFLLMCTRMELTVAAYHDEQHSWQAWHNQPRLRDEEYPFLAGSPDRICTLNGERVIVDFKTTNPRDFKKWKTDGVVSQEYILQMQYYMMLAPDVQTAIIAALDRVTGEYAEYEIRRDNEFITWLRPTLVAWWQKHIIGGEPLPPDNIEAIDGKQIQADADISAAHEVIRQNKKAIKELESECEDAEETIKAYMNDADHLMLGATVIATYKETTRTSVDTKALPEEIKDQYTKTTTYRTLRIK